MLNVFSSIDQLESVNSTNTYLLEKNIPGTALAFTFHQTGGRGRENRVWKDFAGKNLALSVSFTYSEKEIPLWRIATLSIPLAEYLIELGVPDVWIKWPNDIYTSDKKIAGVLAESVFSSGRITRIVAGIGININITTDELTSIDKKASSVFIETGREQNIKSFTEQYIKRLALTITRSSSPTYIRERWCDLSHMIGKEFLWESPHGVVQGKAVALNEDGTLVLETVHGSETVTAGDITLKDVDLQTIGMFKKLAK